MDECSSHGVTITGALFGLYSVSGVVFICFPFLVFALFNMKEPTLPVFIPFVDIDTRHGYIITSCDHYILIFMACVGFGFVDTLFVNLVFNILTMSQLQSHQLTTINEELDDVKQSKTMIRIRMMNFFTMHQEMEKYNTHYFCRFPPQIVFISDTLKLSMIHIFSWSSYKLPPLRYVWLLLLTLL